MSILYRHNYEQIIYDKNSKNIIREKLIDDKIKGLIFTLIIKEEDNYYKISIKQKEDNKYLKYERNNKDITDEEIIDLKQLLSLIDKNKNLKFVSNYLNNIKSSKKMKLETKSDSKSKLDSKSKKSTKKLQSGGNFINDNTDINIRYINDKLD